MGLLDKIRDLFGPPNVPPELPLPPTSADGGLKPGIKTTEWWATLAGVILAAAVSLGLVNSTDSAELGALAVKVIGAVVSLAAGIAAIMQYVGARTDLKASALDNQFLDEAKKLPDVQILKMPSPGDEWEKENDGPPLP